MRHCLDEGCSPGDTLRRPGFVNQYLCRSSSIDLGVGLPVTTEKGVHVHEYHVPSLGDIAIVRSIAANNNNLIIFVDGHRSIFWGGSWRAV